MIFKKVGTHQPYPQHGLSHSDWGNIPPQQVRLDWLTTTQKTLDLETLLAEDSTYFGDLFPHVVKWGQELYLEDGLHRALRTALHSRAVMYARILDLDSLDPNLLRTKQTRSAHGKHARATQQNSAPAQRGPIIRGVSSSW